jgi:carboxyl-terminal processing protease
MARRVVVLVVLLAGGWYGYQGLLLQRARGDAKQPLEAPPVRRGLTDKDYEMFRRLVDVMDQVERNYVDKGISREQLLEAAMRGVMKELDPYSNYIAPKDVAQFRTGIDQKFGGIGLQVGPGRQGSNFITVISPIVGSPAYKAGVHAGDQIVEIEGKSAEGISVDEAVSRLKGDPGTEVAFTIQRAGSTERKVIKVTREEIKLETVLGDSRNADDSWNYFLDPKAKIGYIRVTAFSGETAEHLRAALKQLTGQGMRGLILDLRFNPGGLLGSAVESCDMFIDEGVIVSVKNRNGTERPYKASKLGTFKAFPMAVLVNRYSASASEIVSACLQDHKRAVIIGEQTWGKASVQSVVELEGGGALKLTTATYHRPNGKNIHKPEKPKKGDTWGVIPNEGFRIDLPDEEFGKLMLHLRERDLLHAKGEKSKDPDYVDKQRQKAVDYLTTQLAKAE